MELPLETVGQAAAVLIIMPLVVWVRLGKEIMAAQVLRLPHTNQAVVVRVRLVATPVVATPVVMQVVAVLEHLQASLALALHTRAVVAVEAR